MGEAILIVALAVAAAMVLSGLNVFKQVRRRGENAEFERQVLDELEALHLRMDMISERLDGVGIESPPESPTLPGDLG